MSQLETTAYYALQEVVDHLDTGGTLDFNDYYSIKILEKETETKKAWLFSDEDANKFWVSFSHGDYTEGDSTVDIKGWLLDKIISEL